MSLPGASLPGTKETDHWKNHMVGLLRGEKAGDRPARRRPRSRPRSRRQTAWSEPKRVGSARGPRSSGVVERGGSGPKTRRRLSAAAPGVMDLRRRRRHGRRNTQVVKRGDLLWADLGPRAGRRPAVILTRDEVIPFLESIVVAPVTRTIRDIDSEVSVGAEDGLDEESVINCDN